MISLGEFNGSLYFYYGSICSMHELLLGGLYVNGMVTFCDDWLTDNDKWCMDVSIANLGVSSGLNVWSTWDQSHKMAIVYFGHSYVHWNEVDNNMVYVGHFVAD